MLLALRRARSARFVLLAAGFLAVSGSFGLHPEPGPLAGRAQSRAGWTAANLLDRGSPHECLACLAHRSISLPGPSAVVLQSDSSIPAASPASPSPFSRLDAPLVEGRAPPALG